MRVGSSSASASVRPSKCRRPASELPRARRSCARASSRSSAGRSRRGRSRRRPATIVEPSMISVVSTRRRRSRRGRTRRRVHAGQLGGLAADQRAAACSQPSAMPLTTSRGELRRRACRWRSSRGRRAARRPHEDVVHAHRHEVDADRVVAAQREGELELGADAVGAARPAPARGSASGSANSAPKPPMPPSTSGRIVRLRERLDALDERVARVDVDAGVAVGEGFGRRGQGARISGTDAVAAKLPRFHRATDCTEP